MIFPTGISVKLGLLTQNLAQNCPPKPDKSEHEARFKHCCLLFFGMLACFTGFIGRSKAVSGNTH